MNCILFSARVPGGKTKIFSTTSYNLNKNPLFYFTNKFYYIVKRFNFIFFIFSSPLYLVAESAGTGPADFAFARKRAIR